MHTFILEHKNL